MNLFRVIVLGFACAVPMASFAQWQWIDKDGRKVFSDQSPPADVPAKNILRRPGERAAPVAEAQAQAAASQPKPAASALRIGGKEKELDDKKKQAEAAEAQKKKAQEDEIARMRADNCERARRSKATFESGVRISRMNDKGEREFMDEGTRAAEAKRIDGVIARDCKSAGS